MQSNCQRYHRACTEATRFTKEGQPLQTQRRPQPQGSKTHVTLFVWQAHTKKTWSMKPFQCSRYLKLTPKRIGPITQTKPSWSQLVKNIIHHLICKEHVCSSYPRWPCLPLLCAFKAAGSATNLNILPRFKRWNTQQTLTLKANNNWFHFNLVLAILIVLDQPFWLKTEIHKNVCYPSWLEIIIEGEARQ